MYKHNTTQYIKKKIKFNEEPRISNRFRKITYYIVLKLINPGWHFEAADVLAFLSDGPMDHRRYSRVNFEDRKRVLVDVICVLLQRAWGWCGAVGFEDFVAC